MKLQTILTTGETAVREHDAITKAIRAAEIDLGKLDAQLIDAKQRAESAAAGQVLGNAGSMADSANAALHSVQVRHAAVTTLLSGLRSRLIDVQHEGNLKAA